MAEPTTRLFLISPVLIEAEPFAGQLAQALEGGDVACLLLRHAARDERGAKTLLREIVSLAQKHEVAVLLENDLRLAAHLDADGVQISTGTEALEDALERFKPDRIVGCANLPSRDDAMTVGEAEVDYLLFGEPDQDGTWPEPAWTVERVRWWAEIFNLPCVGVAQSLDQVGLLTEAGADFIGLGEAAWAHTEGPAAAVRAANASILAATPPEDAAR